ncbi:hypothetical protein IPdc08_01618 [archaeon]|nr:hypothetical protein IPdc08_01618 [archaeon]
MFTGSASTPIVLLCIPSFTTTFPPKGRMPSFFHVSIRSSGACSLIQSMASSPCCLPKSCRALFATSMASSFLSFVSAPSIPRPPAILLSFASSLILYGALPMPASRKSIATCLAWSIWDAAPPIVFWRSPLATIVSAVAPHTPLGEFGVILHGPILQFLQETPSSQNLHFGSCF